jgi:hypothetical protein
VFEDIRRAFHELLNGNVPAADRRGLLQEMRDTLVRAKMALDDLRQSVVVTEKRLQRERTELETVVRRKGLAESRGDAETVAVATKFELHHAERLAILEKKLDAERGELAMLEKEVEEMTTQLKAANSGVGSGMRAGAVGEELDLDSRDSELNRDLNALDRERKRAAHDADAEARLAELKRRMGR